MRLSRGVVGLSLLSCVFATYPKAAESAEMREALGRAVVARAIDDGQVYVGWRLLPSDSKEVGFHVYRRVDRGKPVRLTEQPKCKTTDLIDTTCPADGDPTWFVRPVIDGREGKPSAEARLALRSSTKDYLSIPLRGDYTFQKVGIADLDGDRRYDFVIKQPNGNIDPWYKYWKPADETYKLEAYDHDGRFLWRYDLGWAIERGIWYSPYVVYDLDGDGRAEVAVKTGEGDPRDEDKKVTSGPEYVTILDGRTGQPITRTDWPSREGFTGEHAYNYYCRNQMSVAYLDGKRPHLIVNRGTYNVIKLAAYRFENGRLHLVWKWDNRDAGKEYWGQGAHWMHSGDVDGDGRDELAIGSAMIDDDGTPLWSTGLGHPDHFYLGDIDPTRPGLEIYFGIEPGRKQNAMCLADARTGEILWGHDQPTKHIHSSGLCADIDRNHPGSECYSGERDFADKRWLRDSRGQVLSNDDLGGLAPRAAYWDADLQREVLRGGRLVDFGQGKNHTRIEGHVAAVADILGDWREEMVTSVAGELRIYTTTIPAIDRRPCLMTDPIYRADVINAAMGYLQVPMTSYDLEAQGE